MEQQAERDLLKAATEGNLATLTSLVKQGVNLEAKDWGGFTALIYAAAFGKLDCLDHLIATGANLDS